MDQAHSVLILQKNGFVLQDIVEILADLMPDVSPSPCATFKAAAEYLNSAERVALAVVDLPSSKLGGSVLDVFLKLHACPVVHIDDFETEAAIVRDNWVRLQKPFSDDSFRRALFNLGFS